MREVVEESKPAQQIELLLLVDSVVLFTQVLMDLRKSSRKLRTRRITLLRLLLKCYGRHVLQRLGNFRAQRVNRLRSSVDDLM